MRRLAAAFAVEAVLRREHLGRRSVHPKAGASYRTPKDAVARLIGGDGTAERGGHVRVEQAMEEMLSGFAADAALAHEKGSGDEGEKCGLHSHAEMRKGSKRVEGGDPFGPRPSP